LSGHADGDGIATQVVAGQELLERLARELVGVGIGLAEDLGVFDVVEGRGRERTFVVLEAERLEGTLAEVDAPHTGCLDCHTFDLPASMGPGRDRPGSVKEHRPGQMYAALPQPIQHVHERG